MSDDAAVGRLEALRESGAWRADPARFAYLEALSARIPGQPAAVQRVLQAKLEAALGAYAAPPAARATATAAAPAGPSPLVELNAYIRRVTADRTPPAVPGEAAAPDELASVRRFRRTWERHRTQDQLAQALARRPANAGPLNSHALVLRSLALMQELSPDYLRRFLVHAESLLWLEQARALYPRERAVRGNTKGNTKGSPKSAPRSRRKPGA